MLLNNINLTPLRKELGWEGGSRDKKEEGEVCILTADSQLSYGRNCKAFILQLKI